MREMEVLHTNYQLIEKAIKYIDAHFKEQPSIDVIASSIGMSKYHFIRVFKEYVGVTPKQFLHSVTLNYAKEHIKESKSILDSTLDMGLSSVSRLHELFVNLIGVTPKEWREKGRDVIITYGFGITPFGEALIAYTDKGICYLGFIDQNKEAIFTRFKELWENANLVHDDLKAQTYLENIFINNKKYNLLVKGTNLQINVWKALLNLPNGVIATYQDIANYVEKPNAVRAVASAIGQNHIGYLIPCHRVIAKSGAMSGYRWGIERKKILIAYESTYKESRTDCRMATLEDIPTVCQFLHTMFPQHEKKQAKALSEMIQNASTHSLFLAIQETKVVGMLPVLYRVSIPSGEKIAMFEEMVMDEAYKNHSIEKELLQYAITSCTKMGCQEATLLAKEASFYTLYEELGFEKSQRELFTCKALRGEF
ncbi:MAG: Bifunctional transcriptional activator/DNA repair enzyme Ada [Proteobacteria bacterium]|nr:Bifunctional transcriptional activator/DNA repair enzyme Ada [Pseudomonadota bacterium]